MHNCERCNKPTSRRPGKGHYYCSPECARLSRLEQHKKAHRQNYLYLMGSDGKRHCVRVKKRQRPDGCELCHRSRGRMHYHHWDDAKPEEGLWLCALCHAHAEFYEQGWITQYVHLKKAVTLRD